MYAKSTLFETQYQQEKYKYEICKYKVELKCKGIEKMETLEEDQRNIEENATDVKAHPIKY